VSSRLTRLEGDRAGTAVAGTADAGAILDLVRTAGWAYSRSDIERLIRIEPEGMLVAVDRSGGARGIVGCVYAPLWGRLGFIGLLLVRTDLRRRGVGAGLLAAGLDRLRAAGCSAVGLDSVPEAVSLYRRAGFEADWESMRLAIDTKAAEPPPGDVVARELEPREGGEDADIAAVLGLDLRGWGADRGRLLTELRREGSGVLAVAPSEGTPLAYGALRRGPYGWRMGPWVAEPTGEGAVAARAVLAWALRRAHGLPLTVGVPAYNTAAVEAMNRIYAVRMRSCVRMYLGDPGPARAAPGSWAIGAPEKG
jgi:ribosomal protein S18 acetylase RimI-like enzyme